MQSCIYGVAVFIMQPTGSECLFFFLVCNTSDVWQWVRDKYQVHCCYFTPDCLFKDQVKYAFLPSFIGRDQREREANRKNSIEVPSQSHLCYCLQSDQKNTILISIWNILCFSLQWNPINTDTNGTHQSVRIIPVSVISGLSEKRPRHMFTATKRFVTETSGNQRNLALTLF